MSVFGFPSQSEFEDFKREVHERLERLSSEISQTASESADTASAAAKNVLTIEEKVKDDANKIQGILNNFESLQSAIRTQLDSLEQDSEKALTSNAQLNDEIGTTREIYKQINESKSKIDSATIEVESNVEKINEYLEQSKEFPESLKNIKEMLEESKVISESINSLLAHVMKRKGEVDDLYKSIYGEDIKDSEGRLEHTDGIRDELEKSYLNISERVGEIDTTIKDSLLKISSQHENEFKIQRESFEQLLRESDAKITDVDDQLKSLLPGAMAAGLSAAYEQKKEDEIKSLEKFDKNFNFAIKAMVTVSLIPFAVDIYLLAWLSKDLVNVIKDTPSLMISILPLYFPILWLAYSSNKKVNLSKRLIEEYTHKAVLGKTFSGLSNQIDALPHENAVKDELRTRLLFTVLQVSAENPGKLISNYSKSDHPLMDALENSAKLSDAVDALAKIPGFGAIAKKLSERSLDLVMAQTQKVEHGLATQESLETPIKD